MVGRKLRRTKDEGRRTKRYALCAMRYAQSVLESVVAYAAVMAIFFATMGIFYWGMAHIGARQLTYQATRVMAGTPRGRNVDENGAQGAGYSQALWPTYLAGGGVANAF